MKEEKVDFTVRNAPADLEEIKILNYIDIKYMSGSHVSRIESAVDEKKPDIIALTSCPLRELLEFRDDMKNDYTLVMHKGFLRSLNANTLYDPDKYTALTALFVKNELGFDEIPRSEKTFEKIDRFISIRMGDIIIRADNAPRVTPVPQKEEVVRMANRQRDYINDVRAHQHALINEQALFFGTYDGRSAFKFNKLYTNGYYRVYKSPVLKYGVSVKQESDYCISLDIKKNGVPQVGDKV